jgi:uncharacterized membrane protein
MSHLAKKTSWVIIGIFSFLISLYPITYFVLERTFGLLSYKSVELLSNLFWNISFYGHIIFGGIALAIGWLQFNKKWRAKNIKFHRIIGKTYVISVIISGLGGLYIGFFATGGLIASLGFISLALVWLGTTLGSYQAILNKNIKQHEQLMIYSFAACFAAVTLRMWLPILIPLLQGDFIFAYQIVAWLCWLPNLLVAFIITKKA